MSTEISLQPLASSSKSPPGAPPAAAEIIIPTPTLKSVLHNEEMIAELIQPANANNLEQLFEIAKFNGKVQTSAKIGHIVGSVLGVATVGLHALRKMIVIKQGQMAFGIDNSVPFVFGAGRHFYLSPLQRIVRVVPENIPHITFENLHLINIRQGEIGLGRDNGVPVLLSEGRHFFQNSLFKFEKSVDVLTKVIKFDPIQIITVPIGFVGVSYIRGQLILLPPGERYVLKDPLHTFSEFVSLQQVVKKIPKQEVLSSDIISLQIEGLLVYQIRDVTKLVTHLGPTELHRALLSTARSSINTIFSLFTIQQISPTHIEEVKAQSGVPPSYASTTMDQISEESVRGTICKKLKSDLENFASPLGVDILSLQIESIWFSDGQVQSSYESVSITFAVQATKLCIVEAESAIKIREAKADADAKILTATGNKTSAIIEAEGQKEAIILVAEGQKQASDILANSSLGTKLAVVEANTKLISGLKAKTLLLGDRGLEGVLGNSELVQ